MVKKSERRTPAGLLCKAEAAVAQEEDGQEIYSYIKNGGRCNRLRG